MKTSPEFLAAIAERLGWALLHSLWQGTIISLLLACALLMMHRRSAAARHALCLFSMLALVGSMAATAWVIRPSVVAVAGGARPKIVLPDLVAAAAVSVDEIPAREKPVAAGNAPAAAVQISWRERFEPALPIVSMIWILGVLLLSARHLVGWQKLNALRGRSVAARGELEEMFQRLLERFGRSGAVRLLESAEEAVPMLAGFLKPVVLLPMSVIAGLSPREIEAILAHELAHLVRRDAWSNFAQLAVETLFFYHPAMWWIGRRTREEREIAADDLALRVCADRRIYAGALARLAELNLASTPALAANGGGLLARIQRILRPAPVETLPSDWSFGVPTLITVLALAAVFRTQADDTKRAVPETKPEAKEPAQKPATDAKAWIADAFQLDDKAKREAAIESIRAAMMSGNSDEARAGATAFVQLGPIEFDKASFRPAIRALLASADAKTRAAAATAFTMTGAEAEDMPRIFALADDPAAEVRDGLTYVIVSLTKHDVRDKAASDAILKLMAKLPRDSRSVAHAMWGVKLSPEIEAKVLEFCKDIDQASNGSVGYNFFYGTLSTQANKSEASCKRLIELLAHPDTTNIAGRSAWGLQQGVDREQFPLVADAMVKVIEARSVPYLRNNALRNLRAYGNAAQAPAIKALLAKPGATGDMRKDFEETLAAIEARPVAESESSVVEGVAAVVNDSVITSAQIHDLVEPLEKAAREKFTGDELAQKLKEIRAKAIADSTTQSESGATAKPRGDSESAGISSTNPTPTDPMKLNNPIIRQAAAVALAATSTISAEEATALREKVSALEKRLAQIEVKATGATDVEKLREQNKIKARQRGAQDRQQYKPEELQDIESLYQVANKNWRTDEARTSLKKLLEKYDRANRTGCATLYMGQMSEGQERIDYLTRAVEKFSDCYYFDGCQVGGYGRYVLALTLWEKGEKEKARALFAELKTTYKEATDHKGRPMGEVAEAAEKELAAKE